MLVSSLLDSLLFSSTVDSLHLSNLSGCPQLTDMSVFELSQLPKLRRIGLVRVRRVHLPSPALFLFRTHALVCSFSQVTNLTDSAIHALVERPSSLERIHLSYCENISIDAVHFLLQRLGKLTHLSLTGVPAFRRPDLQKFCRQPPKVGLALSPPCPFRRELTSSAVLASRTSTPTNVKPSASTRAAECTTSGGSSPSSATTARPIPLRARRSRSRFSTRTKSSLPRRFHISSSSNNLPPPPSPSRPTLFNPSLPHPLTSTNRPAACRPSLDRALARDRGVQGRCLRRPKDYRRQGERAVEGGSTLWEQGRGGGAGRRRRDASFFFSSSPSPHPLLFSRLLYRSSYAYITKSYHSRYHLLVYACFSQFPNSTCRDLVCDPCLRLPSSLSSSRQV